MSVCHGQVMVASSHQVPELVLLAWSRHTYILDRKGGEGLEDVGEWMCLWPEEGEKWKGRKVVKRGLDEWI